MNTCDGVRKNLTAFVDGALPGRRSEALRRHVAGCAECAAEAQALQSAIDRHQRLMRAAIVVDDADSAALWQRLRGALDEPLPTERWRHPWLLSGGALAAAAALVAVVAAGGQRAILISVGVESPPPAVTTQPELFKDYRLIQELDALEYFDTVESVPLDDEPTSQNG